MLSPENFHRVRAAQEIMRDGDSNDKSVKTSHAIRDAVLWPLTPHYNYSYNGHMEKVGTAELKNGLSRYLRKVRKGASILVLDHDEPVAELVPVGQGRLGKKKRTLDEAVAEMVARGALLPPKFKKPLKVSKSLDLGGNHASEAVIREREALPW